MTLFDVRVRPEQLKAAAEWAASGDDAADVLLLVDDRMLVVYQGDDKTAFDTGGEQGSDEYVSLAPLDREAPTDMHRQVVATIARIRRDDSDFITPDTLRVYTGCTTDEARAGIVEVFGQEWLDRQDASVREAS